MKDKDQTVNESYEIDDLQLGFVFDGRRLVCYGTDGLQDYEPWLEELVSEFSDLAKTAQNAGVKLAIDTIECFVSAIGVDLDRDFNEECPCASYFYLGWLEPEAKEQTIAEAKRLLATVEHAISGGGNVRKMAETIDNLEYRLNISNNELIGLRQQLKEKTTAFKAERKEIAKKAADRETRLIRLFDLLTHRHCRNKRAVVLGPIAEYDGLFVFCAKENGRLNASRFYLSLWEMIRASGRHRTLEIEKRTLMHSWRLYVLEPDADWTNVWEGTIGSNYTFEIQRPEDPQTEAALTKLIEEGLKAKVKFLDPAPEEDEDEDEDEDEWD